MDSMIFRRNKRKGGGCGCSGGTKTTLQSKVANGAQQLSRQFYTMLGGKRSRKHKRTRRNCRSKSRSKRRSKHYSKRRSRK